MTESPWQPPTEEQDLALLALEFGGEWRVDEDHELQEHCIHSRAFWGEFSDARRQHWRILLIRYVEEGERGIDASWLCAAAYGHAPKCFWYRHGWGRGATAGMAFEEARPEAIAQRDESERWKALLRRQRYTGDALTPEKKAEEERIAKRVEKKPTAQAEAVEQLGLFGGVA